jgi:hypothetical protein
MFARPTQFNGRSKTVGVPSKKVQGVQHYKITNYHYLNPFLGVNWHFRGLNVHCHCIPSAFTLYTRSLGVQDIVRDIPLKVVICVGRNLLSPTLHSHNPIKQTDDTLWEEIFHISDSPANLQAIPPPSKGAVLQQK